jgi:hypothetical protein
VSARARRSRSAAALAALEREGSSAQVYLTGTGHDLEPRQPVSVDPGTLATSAPARSPVTIVVPDRG